MILYILRGAFILLAASVTALYLLPFQEQSQASFSTVVLLMGLTLGAAGVIVAVDSLFKRKQLSAMSGVFLGLLAGLLIAYALSFVVDLISRLARPGVKDEISFLNLMQGVKVFIGLVTCYVSISLVLQTKDDFRFVLPYVEFARDVRGNRPMLLDTSIIIDGRILDILDTHLIHSEMVVPKFVLNELQAIADSGDKLRRARGRRGLDVLQKLRDHPRADVTINDTEVEGNEVDQKLVTLAQSLQAKVMTNDYNLNKVATLRGVDVININDLAKALRPVVLPGEPMQVKIVRAGEGPTQGVGFLDDGTMVVVENARQFQGRDIELIVTSTIQTSAGRMIFGRAAPGGGEPDTDAHGGGKGQDGPPGGGDSNPPKTLRPPSGGLASRQPR
ncbi:MAG: PIN/TRAM domain-containing protein [Planctomycetes bacterium]|nr:PIN/TRAM domain-containing protein [Planctomycetota bacterium]